MKKVIIIILCLLSCCLLACNRQPNEEVVDDSFKPSLDVEKEVVLNIIGGWENFEALDAVETAFNEYYPNVSINYTYASSIETSINNLAPEGKLDLVFYTKNSIWTGGTIDDTYRQYMVDLNTLDLNLSNISPSTLACGQDNGKQYGVHFLNDLNGLIVNEDLLKENGFNVPTSYDEFIAICDAFSAKGTGAILAYNKERMRFFLPFLLKNVASASNRSELISNLNEGVASSEVYSGLIDASKEFTTKGYFNSACENLADNYNACIVEFFKGEVPFLLGSTGTYGGCPKREAAEKSTYSQHPFKYSFIAIPTGETNKSTVLTVSSGMFSVCNTSPNLDYATEFLKFMLRPENMYIFSTTKGMPSSNVKVVNEKYNNLTALDQTYVYSTRSLNLSNKAYNSLRDSIDGLKKDDVSTDALIELFRTSMEK